ncbi:HDOD domain-containing protein [Alteromonas sp. CYL-A6]|uniref:HDOD domain-containing protein n=1 Tax=Alteromonas nitratireducens TaxID=3390813 RepID=UPI0034B0881A
MSDATPPPGFGERFENVLISPLRVYKMLGKRSPGEVTYEESEQSNARRELLRVEKQAIKSRFALAQSEASYLDTLRSELHYSLFHEIKQQIADSGHVFRHVLTLNDDVTALIDILATRAASVSKLEPHAAALPWLYEELLQVVNSASFRRRDSRGRVIVVESLKTALSFLGIENLQMLLPAMIFKRTLPQITDPYPQIKAKLAQYATGSAVTAMALARFSNVKPYPAFVLGMLSHLGRSALIRLYFKYFDLVQREMLQEAQKNKARERHDALLKLSPSPNYLIALQEEYANNLAAELFEHMVFRRVPLAEPMREYARNDVSARGTSADILRQATCYTQVRMLHQHRFIDKDEAKKQLKMARLPVGATDCLRGMNIFELPLIHEQDEENRKPGVYC